MELKQLHDKQNEITSQREMEEFWPCSVGSSRLFFINLAVYLQGSYLISRMVCSYAGTWKLCLWDLGKPVCLHKYVQFCFRWCCGQSGTEFVGFGLVLHNRSCCAPQCLYSSHKHSLSCVAGVLASLGRASARLTATPSPHVNQLSGMHLGSGGGGAHSLSPGEAGFVSSALVFHLISSWLRSTLLSCSQQRLAALQLASFLATPGWAGSGCEHLLGAVWVVFVSVFVKSRSWRNPSLLFSRTLTPPPCIFQMHFWNRACSRELANHCPVTGRKWLLLFIYNANSEESSEVW